VVLHEWGEAREAAEPRPVAGEAAYAKALLRVRKELRGLLPEPKARIRWAAQLGQAARGFPALVARLRRADGLVDAPPAAAAEDVAGTVITWLFAPGGFSPLARLSAEGGHGIVTDQVGAPLVVLDGDGEVRAQVVTDGRGRAQIDGEEALCPWRFAGQYRDTETGLHYNRHRYYDADAGQYISRDPLGLRAGLRVYGYVADAGVQSDPLGLSPKAGDGCGGKNPEHDGDPVDTRTTKEVAAELAEEIGRHRVSARTASGQIDIDLAGKAHYDKRSGEIIETPHVHEAVVHTSPAGQTSLGPKTTRAATMEDIRLARRVIERRN